MIGSVPLEEFSYGLDLSGADPASLNDALRAVTASGTNSTGTYTALISVTIEAFGQEGDRAVLRGQWTLKSQQKAAPAVPHSFSRDEALGKAETPDMVAAMSRLVGALGDEIARSE